MGWASGSSLMSDVIKCVKDKVPDEHRRTFYVAMINAFEDHDCDTLNECLDDDPAFLDAYCETNPYEAGWQAAKKGESMKKPPAYTSAKDADDWLLGFKEYVANN